MQHPDFDVNGWIQREMERVMADEQQPKRDPVDTYPAVGGEGRAWQEFWVDHSNCGGTWVYIKDPCNPRVVCSCAMGMGG